MAAAKAQPPAKLVSTSVIGTGTLMGGVLSVSHLPPYNPSTRYFSSQV